MDMSAISNRNGTQLALRFSHPVQMNVPKQVSIVPWPQLSQEAGRTGSGRAAAVRPATAGPATPKGAGRRPES